MGACFREEKTTSGKAATAFASDGSAPMAFFQIW